LRVGRLSVDNWKSGSGGRWAEVRPLTTRVYRCKQNLPRPQERSINLYRQTTLKYIITNLDRLIGERQRIGVRTLQELTDFHLKFNAISTYLIDADLLSKGEQSQSYLRVFDPVLLNSIQMRLQIQHPTHHPSLPYSLQEIYDAAGWVLQGVSPSSMILPTVAPTSHSQPSNKQGFVKTEQLGSILTEFTKTIVDAIKQALNTPRSTSMPMNRGGQVSNVACNFCGEDHFIHIGTPHCTERFDSRNGHTVSNHSDSMNT